MSFIKFRTKQLAQDWCHLFNEKGIKCEYDGYYNVVGFESDEAVEKASKIMSQYPGIFKSEEVKK